MKNCVYRFLNKNNEVIYIGKASDLKQRMWNHGHLPEECYKERIKIEFCMFDTKGDMDFAERYFIPKIKPKYNTVLSGKIITFDVPHLDNIKWYEFGSDEFIQFQLGASDIFEHCKIIDKTIEFNQMEKLKKRLRL